MKANEMPERIYLFDYNDAMVTPLEGDTVYVREDTFIEKALRWMISQGGVNDALSKEMIDDFRKYIKGEKV